MSHSTVLVVVRNADDVTEAEACAETLLAPFDEGVQVPPYPRWESPESVQSVVTSSSISVPLNVGLRPDEKDTEALAEWTRKAVGFWFANNPDAGVREGEKFGVKSTYNPQSKWDWYVLGGRWRGFFQVKEKVIVGHKSEDERMVPRHDAASEQIEQVTSETQALIGRLPSYGDGEGTNYEGRADLARKGDIDFEVMRTLAGVRADAQYDEFEKATAGLEVPPTWDEIRDKHGAKDFQQEDFSERVESARSEFRNFPWVRALDEARLSPFFGDTHEHWKVNQGGRAAYVSEAVKDAFSTFAILLDGQWHERGDVGWFGIVSDEMDGEDWSRHADSLLNSLPDDAWLAVYDLHI